MGGSQSTIQYFATPYALLGFSTPPFLLSCTCIIMIYYTFTIMFMFAKYHSTISYSPILHFTVLYCTTLYCTVLYCTLLYCLYHTIYTYRRGKKRRRKRRRRRRRKRRRKRRQKMMRLIFLTIHLIPIEITSLVITLDYNQYILQRYSSYLMSKALSHLSWGPP